MAALRTRGRTCRAKQSQLSPDVRKWARTGRVGRPTLRISCAKQSQFTRRPGGASAWQRKGNDESNTQMAPAKQSQSPVVPDGPGPGGWGPWGVVQTKPICPPAGAVAAGKHAKQSQFVPLFHHSSPVPVVQTKPICPPRPLKGAGRQGRSETKPISARPADPMDLETATGCRPPLVEGKGISSENRRECDKMKVWMVFRRKGRTCR